MIDLWTAPVAATPSHPKPEPNPAPEDEQLAAWAKEIRYGERV
jgi:hypothetical protein